MIFHKRPLLYFFCFFIGLSSVAISDNKYHKNKRPIRYPKPNTDKVVCITMPKCGTHLLIKCISLFEQPRLYLRYEGTHEAYKPRGARKKKFDQLNKFDPPHHYKGEFHIPTVGALPKLLKNFLYHSPKRLFWWHWPHTKEAEAAVVSRTIGNFFIIRDPRDMIISMAHMVQNGWNEEHYPVVDDLIYDFIDGRQKHFIRWGVEVHSAYPLLWELGVVGFYKLYLPWMKAKKFHTVYFENLVGSKGGGSDEIQLEEIRKIANHIKVKLSPEQLKKVHDQLFGGSRTFREGQITGWKKHFTPEMKAAFKKTPGANELLIELGYEKDTNW